MLWDLNVLCFKSDYTAHTSTLDLRPSECMQNSRMACCSARIENTLPENLADNSENTCGSNGTDGKDLTRRNPPLLKPTISSQAEARFKRPPSFNGKDHHKQGQKPEL